MTSAQIIVLASPVFLLLIGIEALVMWRRGAAPIRLNDAMTSISLGGVSQATGLFTTLLTVGIYTLAYEHLALLELSATSWWLWPLALVLYDFLYYWYHRAGHRVALIWAAHVVHHQSEAYNLSTALRQTSSGALLGWLFYLPMAVLGVPPLVFGIVAMINLLYQFWVHTEQIGRLGWFDRWFCSPSNHRVHHAVNGAYLDRNYGGIWVVWDRLFGSFAPERDDLPCVYGTRAPLRSFNPIWANLEVYWSLLQDSWRARSWADKLRLWFKPPGWRPSDVAQAWPKAPFDEHAAPQLYNPAVSRAGLWAAVATYHLLLAGVTALLWNAHLLTLWQQLGATLALWGGAWGLAALCGGAAFGSAPLRPAAKLATGAPRRPTAAA